MPFYQKLGTAAFQATRLSTFHHHFICSPLQQRFSKLLNISTNGVGKRYLFTTVGIQTNTTREAVLTKEIIKVGTFTRINALCTKAEVKGFNDSSDSSESTTAREPTNDDDHTPTVSTEDGEISLRALVELEVELYRQQGITMPSVIQEEHWRELLTRTSRKSRKKYLVFLFKNEMKKENRKKKKEEARLIREEKKTMEQENEDEDDDGHIKYGLWRNSFFLYMRDSTMIQHHHSRLVSAMIHGQPLILDMGFDSMMSSRERQNCAYQLQMLFAENRSHPDPYNLYFCNASSGSDTFQRLKRYIPTIENPEFPLNIVQDCYLDQFPKEKLVYLTPHCREEMTTFDHDAIYIVGAIVDTGQNEPVTLAKAKRQGIRMQKLPLERYLEWGIGGKCLTLNQIVSIMLDIKHTGNWYQALSHVPQRKLRPPMSEEELEAMLRKKVASQRKNPIRLGNTSPFRKSRRY